MNTIRQTLWTFKMTNSQSKLITMPEHVLDQTVAESTDSTGKECVICYEFLSTKGYERVYAEFSDFDDWYILKDNK